MESEFVKDMNGLFAGEIELKKFMSGMSDDMGRGFIFAAKALEVDTSLEAKLIVLSVVYLMGRKHALH